MLAAAVMVATFASCGRSDKKAGRTNEYYDKSTQDMNIGVNSGDSKYIADEELTDIDKYLNDYGEYVDSLVALNERIKAGDEDAKTVLDSVEENVMFLWAKIESVKGQMTPTEITRFNSISIKRTTQE